VTDEYALLIAFVEHVESGEADYELSLDTEHFASPNGTNFVYHDYGVYIDEEFKFAISKQEMSCHLISPSRLKPFEDNFMRQKHRKEFRLEDEPME